MSVSSITVIAVLFAVRWLATPVCHEIIRHLGQQFESLCQILRFPFQDHFIAPAEDLNFRYIEPECFGQPDCLGVSTFKILAVSMVNSCRLQNIHVYVYT